MEVYSKEAEYSVLKAVIDGILDINNVANVISVNAFYLEDCKEVYSGLLTAYRTKSVFDVASLGADKAEKFNNNIADYAVTDAAGVEGAIKELRERYLFRCAQDTLSKGVSAINEAGAKKQNVAVLASNLQTTFSDIASKGVSIASENGKALMARVYDSVLMGYKLGTSYIGVPTGYENIDKLLDGLPQDSLIVIAARPSIGKTAFALNLMHSMAKQSYASIEAGHKVMHKIKSAIFSLEMSNMQLGRRLVAIASGMSTYRITHGTIFYQTNGKERLQEALSEVSNESIDYIDGNSGKDVVFLDNIIATIRKLAKTGTKVFFIDHLGLVRSRTGGLKRYEQVHEITFALHRLAQAIHVVIVVLCQLNRNAEGRSPVLSDLRESGDIEQDSDVIAFLHRERAQGGEETLPTNFIVMKNRDGACGTVCFDYFPKITKFEIADRMVVRDDAPSFD